MASSPPLHDKVTAPPTTCSHLLAARSAPRAAGSLAWVGSDIWAASGASWPAYLVSSSTRALVTGREAMTGAHGE